MIELAAPPQTKHGERGRNLPEFRRRVAVPGVWRTEGVDVAEPVRTARHRAPSKLSCRARLWIVPSVVVGGPPSLDKRPRRSAADRGRRAVVSRAPCDRRRTTAAATPPSAAAADRIQQVPPAGQGPARRNLRRIEVERGGRGQGAAATATHRGAESRSGRNAAICRRSRPNPAGFAARALWSGRDRQRRIPRNRPSRDHAGRIASAPTRRL